jgi:hypothetical protein
LAGAEAAAAGAAAGAGAGSSFLPQPISAADATADRAATLRRERFCWSVMKTPVKDSNKKSKRTTER